MIIPRESMFGRIYKKNIDLLDNETKPRHLKENIFDSMKIEPVEIGITIIVGYDI